MNNAELEKRAQNQEKEHNRKAPKEPYEIPDAKCDWEFIDGFKNEGIAVEIVKLLMSKNLNYLEMNEVLYQTDKALRNKMLQTKLSI